MRELIMRQNLGGGTYNVARLQQQRREINPPDVELQQDDNLHEHQYRRHFKKGQDNQ